MNQLHSNQIQELQSQCLHKEIFVNLYESIPKTNQYNNIKSQVYQSTQWVYDREHIPYSSFCICWTVISKIQMAESNWHTNHDTDQKTEIRTT
jgi:hypothetical protein